MDNNDLKKRLADLQVLEAKTRESERRILAGAVAMYDELTAQIERLRDAAKSGDDQARQDYQEAVMERGRVALVVARARQALASN